MREQINEIPKLLDRFQDILQGDKVEFMAFGMAVNSTNVVYFFYLCVTTVTIFYVEYMR